MPRKNIYKSFQPNTFYHIYNRGVEKKNIFLTSSEKQKFQSLLNRYLDPNSLQVDQDYLKYRQYFENIELLAYCIMDNHYHLLIYLKNDVTAMPELMKSLGTAYTQYFNKKHNRLGPLFESRYKAVSITNDEQLRYISQYIHLNPRNPLSYKHSSIHGYLDSREESLTCLNPRRILDLFNGHNYIDILKEQRTEKLQCPI